MTTSFDDSQRKLIERILTAPSQDDVKRFIDVEMKNIRESDQGTQGIVQFTDKIIQGLYILNPLNFNADQWSNIKMARIHFNYLRFNMKVDVG